MRSSRDEILAALRDNPDGLTSKELAPLCPSAECDEMIVGRSVGKLRSEEEIHAIGLREGATIYKLGPPDRQDEAEPRITLPEHGQPPRLAPVSDAARAIAAMRQPKAAGAAPKLQPAAPVTTTAAAPAAIHHEEEVMDKGKLLSHIVAAPEGLKSAEAKKLGGPQFKKLLQALLKEKLIKIVGRARGTRYVDAKGGARIPERAEPRPVLKRDDRAPRAATPPAKNGGPHFAISEHGELGIDDGDRKVSLDPSAFTRLREFIERTKLVWEPSAA